MKTQIQIVNKWPTLSIREAYTASKLVSDNVEFLYKNPFSALSMSLILDIPLSKFHSKAPAGIFEQTIQVRDSRDTRSLILTALSKSDIVGYYERFKKMYPVDMFESDKHQHMVATALMIEHNVADGSGLEVDDGPGVFFRNLQSFKNKADRIAALMGWQVYNYMLDKELEAVDYETSWPNGSGELPMSWFPIGVGGKVPRYGNHNMKGSPAYAKWLDTVQHNIRNLTKMGYKVMDMIDAQLAIKSTQNDTESNLDNQEKIN